METLRIKEAKEKEEKEKEEAEMLSDYEMETDDDERPAGSDDASDDDESSGEEDEWAAEERPVVLQVRSQCGEPVRCGIASGAEPVCAVTIVASRIK